MREVTLYIAQPNVVQAAGDVVSFFRQPSISPSEWARVANDPTTSLKIDMVHAPIDCYRTHIYNQGHDQYLAIDPALKNLLETPFRQKLEDKDLDLKLTGAKLTKLTGVIESFNSFPWWKRVWVSLREIDPHGAANV